VLRRAERPTCDVDGRAKNAKMMEEKGSEGLKSGPLQVAFVAPCCVGRGCVRWQAVAKKLEMRCDAGR
jgi:hypothetical protein